MKKLSNLQAGGMEHALGTWNKKPLNIVYEV